MKSTDLFVDDDRVGVTLSRTGKGGSLVIEAFAVHAHECPYWRIGKSHGDCICGAHELFSVRQEQLVEAVEAAAEKIR